MTEDILNRGQFEELLNDSNFKALADKRILITGADGSIGEHLYDRLCGICKHQPIRTDKENMDVTNSFIVRLMLDQYQPNIIIHLAGMKHAPKGEVNPLEAININITGTYNIIRNQDILNRPCKIVLSSTCKANNPEIVYGATKLIAERLVLNAGGSVARFFNVVETSGNVFEIWEKEKGKKKVAHCIRYFIGLDEAVGLLIYTAMAPAGRYIVNTIHPHNMLDIYSKLYNEDGQIMPPRRGDRIKELYKSTSETVEKTLLNNCIAKLKSAHD